MIRVLSTQPITVNSRWRGKQVPIEVTVARVTTRSVSYVGVYGSISEKLPLWLFLDCFQPLPEAEDEGSH